ncbi:hypothetical protein CBL_00243 [Carabus blaptoides fortunei]
MVSSAGFSTIESICDEQCDHVYDNNGNITTTKKKRSPVEFRGDSKRIEPKNTASTGRSKTRKEPLPMKLRALPQSFWQQPNNTPSQSPGTLCPALPLLCKEEVAECITTDTPTSLHLEEVPATSCQKEIVSDANTDLLFSLFRVVEEEQRRCQGEPKVTVVRRGRPKKPPRGALKDDDPCLVSTVTESLLPLLPERPSRDMQTRTATQGQQSLTVVSVHGERPATASISTTSPATAATSQNYSHLLSEVVFSRWRLRNVCRHGGVSTCVPAATAHVLTSEEPSSLRS